MRYITLHASSPVRYLLILIFMTGLWTLMPQVKGQVEVEKTKSEIDAIIKTEGSAMPDWWDSLELDYPKTLDMTWPVRQNFPGGGGQQRGGRGEPRSDQASPVNVDDYLIQVIYPNPSRHKMGIKLVHHLMILHKDDTQKLKRSLNILGDMFYQLTGDYARAAFWWQKYAQLGGTADSLKMAYCYYKLGSKTAAEQMLLKIDSSVARNNKDLIKMWARIGEVDKALGLIETGFDSSGPSGPNRRGQRGLSQSNKYLLLADLCRGACRYDDAIAYYEKILALPDSEIQPMGRQGTNDKTRAAINLAATRQLKSLDLSRIPDGSYSAIVNAFGGPMTVRVEIKNKRIESVNVTKHSDTYSYLMTAMPITREIALKQGFQGVHAVTGATISSDGIINASAKALVEAMK